MSTVLVTGGAGYIGSHTAKLLSREGIEPIVYDNLVDRPSVVRALGALRSRRHSRHRAS